MSKHFEKVKDYYDRGLWTKKMVYNVVSVNTITPEEYEIITGEVYE